jgi:hypothetical protein
MAHSITLPRPHAASFPAADAVASSIPWYIWTCVVATSSAVVGALWDISWHESIGRDSFLTPAHLLIYLCGVLAAVGCGYLILATSFSPLSRLRSSSVGMWGFHAPLGAFVTAWGGVAMLVSAPFDNWWHNAYGLDVKVLSPPHTVLILGIMAIRFGTLLLILGEMNRASEAARAKLDWLFLYLGAILIGGIYGAFMEFTSRVSMHTARFYLITGITIPLMLAGVARASRHRWAATIATGMMFLITAVFVWVLPLFPASPKLGPVYHNVTHFVAPEFPKLLIVGAFLFDLIRGYASRKGWNDWKLAAVGGVAFLGTFLAVQWPFADFLMSPASRNWFFATDVNAPYFVPETSGYIRNVFDTVEPTAQAFAIRIILAFLFAIVTMRAGLAWGASMRRIRR